MIRETGYYWVKYELGKAWEMAWWDSISQYFSVFCIIDGNQMVEESWLQEINETRILNPDEL